MLAANVTKEEVRVWINISINGYNAVLELAWAVASGVPVHFSGINPLIILFKPCIHIIWQRSHQEIIAEMICNKLCKVDTRVCPLM